MDVKAHEVVVLGLGNLLWADEGFGIRAVEALNERYRMPEGVLLVDGGTQGMALMEYVTGAQRMIVLDAIDFGLTPGTLQVVWNDAVPAWGGTKVSPHQTGFEELLAVAKLRGTAPEAITLVGVQPERLDDFGGSLTDTVRARLDDAVAEAVQQLRDWGYLPTPRAPDERAEPLSPQALALTFYEQGRPSEDEACRIGDPRVLAMRLAAEHG